MRGQYPSDKSSLLETMTSLVSGNIRLNKLQYTRESSSISQISGKSPKKKMHKMIHIY